MLVLDISHNTYSAIHVNCQGAVLIVSYNIYSVKHVNCKGAILLLDKLWIIDYNITMAETNWAKAQKEVVRWEDGT